MRIIAQAQARKELFKRNPDALRRDLTISVCKELIKHNVFIEPPHEERDDIVILEMVLFALTYDDIDKLKELSLKYTELKDILHNIIVKV